MRRPLVLRRDAPHRPETLPIALPHPTSSHLLADQRYCQELTRREAANFYWGFVALPHRQRIAIYALYSFARQVDDAVDLSGNEVPLERFGEQRDRIVRCYTGQADDPVMRVLAEVVVHYGIPREELEALIEGVETDLRVTRYGTWDELHGYCRLVASSIGRMCVRIFGYDDPAALDFADDLGVAMQLANILRDVREDLELGRVYLPQDELARFGVGELNPGIEAPPQGWEPLVRHQIERAERYFQSGLQVTTLIPRRAAVCVLTMAGIYQAIVAEIAQDPFLPLTRRAALTRRAKLSVMLRSWQQAW